MDERFAHLLSKIDFFKLLPDTARLEILPFLEEVMLRPGDILFVRGSESDFVYILLEGQLVGLVKEKIVTMFYPFEVMGELSAFSKEPRSLTIRAETDSKLLKIPSALFEKVCNQYPAVLTSIIKTVISRSQETYNYIEEKKKSLFVIFFAASAGQSYFAEFQTTFKNFLPNQKIAILQEKDLSTDNILDLLTQLEAVHDVVILLMDSHHAFLVKIAMTRQFKFYLVADARDKFHTISDTTKNLMQQLKFLPGIKPNLVLLHSDDLSYPKETSKWLDTWDYQLHHHVRMHNQLDYQRLFRFAFGVPVGLVLGGGGTRCWVHGGVIKALIEKRIPIDAIGGTSSGAWMAAGYAISKSYEDYCFRYTNSIRASYKSFSVRDLTWPAISIYSGRTVTESLRRNFKDKMIENLWIPFFCNSSNLTDYLQTIHHRGLIWEKVRSSIAMPGIIPPVVMDGDMHFDGGLMNNLPVNVMKEFLGLRGMVIACKLGQYKSSHGEFIFPPVVGFKESFLIKFGKTNYKFPEFFDTLIRTLMIGSFSKEKENGAAADILISPDLSDYGMIDSYKPNEEEHLIQLGYDETIKELAKYKKT